MISNCLAIAVVNDLGIKYINKKASYIIIKEKGVILVHDCLPKKIWNQIVPRLYGHWNGDVWKAIVHSRTYEYADTYTCKVDHGLGVIFKRNNRNLLKLNDKSFKNLKFSEYYYHHNEYMNIINSEELSKIF